MASLSLRHIQDMSEAQTLQHHWGYADRALPCTNDAGSCEYLDVVYHAHDLGVLYSGILWATILGILFTAAIWRSSIGRPDFHPYLVSTISRLQDLENKADGNLPGSSQSSLRRLISAISSSLRRHLLPEVPRVVRPIFSHITRLQLLILTVLVGYLTIWTFVGITYKTWVTPVKNMPGIYNTRTSLGPWSDRIGVLAYALTPLSILLSSRESVLSRITGVPYQSFNFLHRWLGYIIFVQASLHTIGWCVIEMRLYQPQPTVGLEWIKQTYMIWGCIAMFLLTILFVFSTPWMIRRTGYEFFRKSHYVLAMLYVGACWAHWSKLACWMIASLVVWLIDRGVRLVRTMLLHYSFLPNGKMGFASSAASVKLFQDKEGDVVRLDFIHPHDEWKVGQHFYLCFPSVSIWQSHPFTPFNLPGTKPHGQQHSYVFRAKEGETSKLAKLAAAGSEIDLTTSPTMPVILAGPYGQPTIDSSTNQRNMLCVAGGTGITYVLPVLSHLAEQVPTSRDRKIELIWAVRRRVDIEWVKPELETLHNAAATHGIVVRIFVTRENDHCASLGTSRPAGEAINEDKVLPSSSASSSSEDIDEAAKESRSSLTVKRLSSSSRASAAQSSHPDLSALVREFVSSTVAGPTTVYASGPGGMIADLRSTIAECNSGREVRKGNDRFDVDLKYDDRLEW